MRQATLKRNAGRAAAKGWDEMKRDFSGVERIVRRAEAMGLDPDRVIRALDAGQSVSETKLEPPLEAGPELAGGALNQREEHRTG